MVKPGIHNTLWVFAFCCSTLLLGNQNKCATAGNPCFPAGYASTDSIPPFGIILQATNPDKVSVQGDLLNRIKRAQHYLDQAGAKDIWNGFTEGMWGADWAGRTLEAYSRVAFSTGLVSTRFKEIGEGLLLHQAKDGSFPIGKASFDYEKTAGLWFGNARGMMGLLWAFKYTRDNWYLVAARALGDYYISHYFTKNQPAPPGSFWWVGTEAMCALYTATKEIKYLNNAVSIAQTIPPVLMTSQHTHSYLLSLRGILQVYEVTRDTVLWSKVLQQYTVFRNTVMWPGGGIVEHLGDSSTYNPDYWYDEGCSVADWLGLNLDYWRITQDANYMDMVERIACNHLLFAQDISGGFCGDRSIDNVREGAPWAFCCAMHGTRALAEITQYIAVADDRQVYINLFYPAEIDLTVQQTKVKAVIQTDYPHSGALRITVSPARPLDFELKIRVPLWSRILALNVNGSKIFVPEIREGYVTLSRRWHKGDNIALTLHMPLHTERRSTGIAGNNSIDRSKLSLWKGPRQLVFNQELNMHLWKTGKLPPALRSVYQAYDTLCFNRSVKGTVLRIGNKTYPKGLGTHAVSEVEYSLGGQFKEFRADIGIDEAAGDNGAVRFKVCVDGVVKAGTSVAATTNENSAQLIPALYGFKTTAATGKDTARPIRVNVANAWSLRLVVDDAVNGLAQDYANWAGACLVKNDGTKVYLTDLPDLRHSGGPLDYGKVDLREIQDTMGSAKIVSLAFFAPGLPQQTIRFNYLGDLGDSLILHRPVLNSWITPLSR